MLRELDNTSPPPPPPTSAQLPVLSPCLLPAPPRTEGLVLMSCPPLCGFPVAQPPPEGVKSQSPHPTAEPGTRGKGTPRRRLCVFLTGNRMTFWIRTQGLRVIPVSIMFTPGLPETRSQQPNFVDSQIVVIGVVVTLIQTMDYSV